MKDPNETIWFRGENGGIFTCQRDQLGYTMINRFGTGHLTRVNPDGTAWNGLPLRHGLDETTPLTEETTLDTLRGYRYWCIDKNANRLMSANRDYTWRPGGWIEAACRRCDPVPGLSPCRDYGYGCGLYAALQPVYSITNVRQYAEQTAPPVWGAVEAKGRIILHDDGFRAQFARIMALEGDGTEATRRIAAIYGVPLLHEDALLAEYPPRD